MPERLAASLAENQALRTEVAELRLENKFLREKLDALARRIFGAQSERLDSAQLELLLQGITDGRGACGSGGATALEASIAEA